MTPAQAAGPRRGAAGRAEPGRPQGAATRARVYLITFNPISDAYRAGAWSPGQRARQRAVYARYRDALVRVGAAGAQVVDVHGLFTRALADPVARELGLR